MNPIILYSLLAIAVVIVGVAVVLLVIGLG